MTRFRDLLKPTLHSTPMDEQQHASAELARALASSRLQGWQKGSGLPYAGPYLLLAVAPYSQYDLTLLDLIDEEIGSGRSETMPVYVVNLLDYENPDQVRADFPGLVQVHQTPLAILCDFQSHKEAASGKQARTLVACALQIDPDELSRKVIDQTPAFTGQGKT